MKKYQLVLQFPGESMADSNTMNGLEAVLTGALGEEIEVDGQDAGTDFMNLFLYTDDPQATFAKVKPLLERREQLEWVTAAYREADLEDFTVIWPVDWRKEFKFG